MQDIFQFLISSILPALADPAHAYNNQHFYVLHSLAEVKSIALLTDIPDSEKLTANLFVIFFDMLAGSSRTSSGDQIGKNVEYNIAEILIIMIDESITLPPEVVDVIVAQFLCVDPRLLNDGGSKNKKGVQPEPDSKQSTLPPREFPPSYNMAKTICNTSADKMARYISQYFNDIILDASTATSGKTAGKKRKFGEDLSSSDLEVGFEPSEEDLSQLRKAHKLLRELWRACPGVLVNVIPQLEAELSAENVHLRLLATETFGDMISGVGAAGCPTPMTLDPTVYPYIKLSDPVEVFQNHNVLTKPCSPQPFSQSYSQAYNGFLSRCHDKSPNIRAAWTTAVGCILRTSAGGVGLSQPEEQRLIQELPRMLSDADDKVRIAAVRTIGNFSLRYVVLKLGALGGIDQPGSLLCTLAERVRDRKHSVRTEAMLVLSRLWGVAVGELLQDEARVGMALGAVPSRILDTYYTNDLDVYLLIDRVVVENLLPLNFPPLQKAKSKTISNGTTLKESHVDGTSLDQNFQPDNVRTERILLLVKGLDEKAKKVFYAIQGRQQLLGKAVSSYLKTCEDFNGGVIEKNEKEIKSRLAKLIDSLSKGFPEQSKFADHLMRFAKQHDRRAYALIRYSVGTEHDYRTIVKAKRELTRRLEESSNVPQDMQASLLALLRRVGSFIYNRSHVPVIMQYSRADTGGLSEIAHEMLRDISTRTPEVLKAQIQDICAHLQEDVPTGIKANNPGVLNDLKACAAYASRHPKDIPKDRDFFKAMMAFAFHGAPAQASKFAVSIILAVSDKKEMHARDIIQHCVRNFTYGTKNFLCKLAALSQVMLLAPEQTDNFGDEIMDITIAQILLQRRTNSKSPEEEYAWSEEIDEECQAKIWALKILVNRVRGHNDPDTLPEVARPVLDMLFKLIDTMGDLSPANDTPQAHRPRLRLTAARQSLKICTKQSADRLFTPVMFNKLSLVAQDPLDPVRTFFFQRLKKYLGASKLPHRFYTLPFMMAFEPIPSLQSDAATWLRTRTNYFHSLKGTEHGIKNATVLMEFTFARLISLLAHHPDYSPRLDELADFARFILFYLKSVADPDNMSLIYHIAQRVKQMRDAVTPSEDTNKNLYHISDLAQMTIRKFEEAHDWSMQTQPAKASLPKSLYTEIRDHEEAQEVADKDYLPSDMEDRVEALIRSSMKAGRSTHQSRKRRSETEAPQDNASKDIKRVKTLPLRKGTGTNEKKVKLPNGNPVKAAKKPAPKKKKNDVELTPGERRRSGRVRADEGLYHERDDDEDDEEMMDGVDVWEYDNGKKEKVAGDTVKDRKKASASEKSSTQETDQWAMPSTPPSKRPLPQKKTEAKTKTSKKGAKR